MLRFADELKGNRLTVVGAVVDLADDLHQGAGKLSIINVNGETDSSKLENVEKLLENTASTGTKKRKKNAPG
jgi:carbonic anhydrase